MILSGRYSLSINGRAPIIAENAVTDAGLAYAAARFSGSARLVNVVIGLKDDGLAEPADTFALHPSWTLLGSSASTSFSAAGATIQTPVTSIRVITDGVTSGCFVGINGVLFSTADFEPQAIVAGDVVQVQYRLTLSRSA